jgi:hypothetical protein
MLSRNFSQNRFPSKSQELSVTLPNGRTYAVCSKGQYRTVRDAAKAEVLREASEKGVAMDDVLLEKMLDAWQETKSGFATLSWVLSRLTPEQAREWEAKYRFQPVQRNVGA